MQEPVSITEDKLMPIPILTFRHAIRDITFDVFIKTSEGHFAKVFTGATGLDYKKLAEYISKGTQTLYILKEDEHTYTLFVSVTADSIFNDPSTSPEKKVATLLNMTEQNISEIFSQFNVQEETAKSTQKLIHNYVSLMAEKPSTLSMILRLVSHGEYLYYHSIAVAIFGMFIARASGQFNQKMIELIGLGGFLHDVGFTKVPLEILMSPRELTAEQWSVIHTHPKLGLNMIETTKTIPEEVRYMVYQHHEQPSGNGYPNGIRGNVIYYPAKIIAIADSFSALISNRPYRPAYSVTQAIAIIEKSTGKYDPDLVKMLPSLFARPDKRKAA